MCNFELISSYLVIIPGDELDEVRIEGDAGARVEDGRARVGQEIGRYDLRWIYQKQ